MQSRIGLSIVNKMSILVPTPLPWLQYRFLNYTFFNANFMIAVITKHYYFLTQKNKNSLLQSGEPNSGRDLCFSSVPPDTHQHYHILAQQACCKLIGSLVSTFWFHFNILNELLWDAKQKVRNECVIQQIIYIKVQRVFLCFSWTARTIRFPSQCSVLAQQACSKLTGSLTLREYRMTKHFSIIDGVEAVWVMHVFLNPSCFLSISKLFLKNKK